jgi:hypothetical protein
VYVNRKFWLGFDLNKAPNLLGNLWHKSFTKPKKKFRISLKVLSNQKELKIGIKCSFQNQDLNNIVTFRKFFVYSIINRWRVVMTSRFDFNNPFVTHPLALKVWRHISNNVKLFCNVVPLPKNGKKFEHISISWILITKFL